MHDIAPAAPEREHVVFIPRKPGIESIEHTIERGARNELARLCSEYADARLGSRQHAEQGVPEQGRKEAATGPKDYEIVVIARRGQRIESQRMNIGFGWQQRVDHAPAKACLEIIRIVRDDGDVGSPDWRESL